MITFYQYLKEVATNSQDSPEGTNQAILGLISKYGGGALNYDFSNIPPTKKNQRKNINKNLKK